MAASLQSRCFGHFGCAEPVTELSRRKLEEGFRSFENRQLLKFTATRYTAILVRGCYRPKICDATSEPESGGAAAAGGAGGDLTSVPVRCPPTGRGEGPTCLQVPLQARERGIGGYLGGGETRTQHVLQPSPMLRSPHDDFIWTALRPLRPPGPPPHGPPIAAGQAQPRVSTRVPFGVL